MRGVHHLARWAAQATLSRYVRTNLRINLGRRGAPRGCRRERPRSPQWSTAKASLSLWIAGGRAPAITHLTQCGPTLRIRMCAQLYWAQLRCGVACHPWLDDALTWALRRAYSVP